MKILKFLKTRIIDHWQTTLVAVLLLVGFHWYQGGKIDFEDFKEYIVLIGSIVLLVAKDWKKEDPKND